MSQDVISNWVQKAKSDDFITVQPDGVLVIRRVDPKNKGWAIMKIAETIFPGLIKMFEHARDKNGMRMHPSRVRAVALNVAQGIVNDEDKKN